MNSFIGTMPVRQDIEVLPADTPKRFHVGFIIKEIVGIGIVNSRTISKKAMKAPDPNQGPLHVWPLGTYMSPDELFEPELEDWDWSSE